MARREQLADYSDVAAATFWQTMQSHLQACRRFYDEANYWQRLDSDQADECRKIAEAYANAFDQLARRYRQFVDAVGRLAPDAFTQLPMGRCDDCLTIDARKAALAVELITRRPLIPPAKRTKPMSKLEALNYIGWPKHCEGERQARRWFNQCIDDGEYRCEPTSSHKLFVFNVDDFPEKCRKEIAKTG